MGAEKKKTLALKALPTAPSMATALNFLPQDICWVVFNIFILRCSELALLEFLLKGSIDTYLTLLFRMLSALRVASY